MKDEESQDKRSLCSKRFCVGSAALILLICGITGVTVTCFILEQKVLKYNHHYGIIFDAGSSHTDVAVYRWSSQYKDHGTARTKEIAFKNCSDKGISSFDTDPEAAGAMISECIEKVVLKALPHKDVKKTPIYFGATAGMRLLCERNNNSCDAILDSVRHSFNKFTFRQVPNRVKVLTGKEEATFGWITANLLNGALNQTMPVFNNSHLAGALDMGGGSAEISFLPETSNVPEKYQSDINLYGVDYSLYSQSYLCFGFNEAHRRLMAHLIETAAEDKNHTGPIKHPCLNKGLNITKSSTFVWLSPCSKKPFSTMFPINNKTTYTFVGTGSPEKCELHTHKLFNKTYCPSKYQNCTFNGEFQPKLKGKFLAFSGFGKTAKFLKVDPTDDLAKFKSAGQDFCRLNWTEVSHGDVPSYIVSSMCFQAIYGNTFLTYGLKFPEASKDISFVQKVGGTEVGWSLGFMVNATNAIPIESPTYRISEQEFVILLLVSSLLTIMGLAMLVICVVKRRMEKNMKYKYSMIQ